ncbi:hypothetical protein QP572_01330 [Brevibacterium sp. UMB10442]|nr:hypothetical protein [Brevibacterium sp. UMB10442]
MWILLGIIAALAVLAVAVAGSMGLFDSPMTQNPDQLSELDITDENPRFAPAMFGYSRNDVDTYVTRLHDRIRELEGASGEPGETSAPGEQGDPKEGSPEVAKDSSESAESSPEAAQVADAASARVKNSARDK